MIDKSFLYHRDKERSCQFFHIDEFIIFSDAFSVKFRIYGCFGSDYSYILVDFVGYFFGNGIDNIEYKNLVIHHFFYFFQRVRSSSVTGDYYRFAVLFQKEFGDLQGIIYDGFFGFFAIWKMLGITEIDETLLRHYSFDFSRCCQSTHAAVKNPNRLICIKMLIFQNSNFLQK